jgi:hypothetical protein
MRGHEKLMRDLYLSLHERWQLRDFYRMARSERSHIKWALVLLEKYELADPAANLGAGVFSRDDLQRLYNDLARLGSGAVGDALTVGAAAEEMTIHILLTRTLRRARNQDLRMLYHNFMMVARNHLRVFHRLLAQRGINYEPAHLSLETYTGIVQSPIEKGLLDANGEWFCDNRRASPYD